MKKLLELVEQLDALDEELVIFARPEWTCDSDAATFQLTSDDAIPEEPERLGLKYFLEVDIAREFLEDYTRGKRISARERCERLIQYATTDA
jgi:hypothetical protein